MPDASSDMIATAGAPASGGPDPSQGLHAKNKFLDMFVQIGKLQSGLAAQERQEQIRQREQSAQLLTNVIQSHPELAAQPEFMKLYGKTTSPEVAQGMELWGHAESAKRKLMQQQMQNIMQPDEGGAVQPAGGNDLASMRASETQRYQSAQKHYNALAQQAALNPEMAEQLKPVLEALKMDMESHQKNIEMHLKEQEFEQTKSQQRQFHEDTEADRAATRQMQEQTRQESLAQRKQAEEDRKAFQEQSQSLAKERDADKRDAQTAQLGKSIDASRDKILADFSNKTLTQPQGIKARVDSYNSSAAMFYRKHSDAGAPTLLKYSEEPGKLYGTNPKVEAVPPTYGEHNGKSGWLDADNNFYPEK